MSYPWPKAQQQETSSTRDVLVLPGESNDVGLLIRALWFLFIGWWLSSIVITVAYLCCVTIVGLPVGFALFDRIPAVMTLRPRSEGYVTEVRDGVRYVRGEPHDQLPMILRAAWFLLVGWWLGAIYMGIAWSLCALLITLPVGLLMLNRVGAVMTLLRY
ncbi:MAG: YccF domain-containing protein [Chloroflexi bacterium]|nr:YccF domain-containing protein [Chloroflexota bacterium]